MKTSKNLMITLLIFALCISSVTLLIFYKNQSNQLEQFKREEARTFWSHLREGGYQAQSIDRAIAEVLVAKADQERKSALINAQTAAVSGNQTYRNNYNYTKYFENGFTIQRFWSESQTYITFLLEKNSGELSPIQVEQLLEIRERANLLATNLLEYIGLSKNMHEVDYDEVDDYVAQISHTLSYKNEIGKDDHQFQNYLWARNGYLEPRKEKAFSGETHFSKDHLANVAKSFMSELWGPEEQQVVGLVGGGHDPLLGEHYSFSTNNHSKSTSSYQVDISILGGHIIRVAANDDTTNQFDHAFGKMTNNEVINFADGLIERWGEEQMLLVEEEKRDEQTHLTYVPVQEELPNYLQPVNITINHEDGRLIWFNASLYFIKKNTDINNEIILTSDEAVEFLSPLLQANGPITVAIIKGKSRGNQIVYTIPVQGIDRLEAVYINAENGKNEGYIFSE